LIDTIAMIGSPAVRGAVVSLVDARFACLAVASAVSAVSATVAPSKTETEGLHRCIATVDFAVVGRIGIPSSG
jgi:hypothetical protein